MVVHGQLVEPAVCLSDLYDVFLLDISVFLWEGGGCRVSDFFLQRIQILKKKWFYFFFWGGGGVKIKNK